MKFTPDDAYFFQLCMDSYQIPIKITLFTHLQELNNYGTIDRNFLKFSSGKKIILLQNLSRIKRVTNNYNVLLRVSKFLLCYVT